MLSRGNQKKLVNGVSGKFQSVTDMVLDIAVAEIMIFVDALSMNQHCER